MNNRDDSKKDAEKDVTEESANVANEDVILEVDEEIEGEENILAKLKSLREKLKVCEKERMEYLTGWQRAKADYINARKDDEKRRGEIVRYANESLIEDFIPALDGFEMAMNNKETWNSVPENWRKGIEYIHKDLAAVLERNGVTIFYPKEGEKPDLSICFIAGKEKTDDVRMDGLIYKIVKKGYRIGEKVLRPAEVIVYSI